MSTQEEAIVPARKAEEAVEDAVRERTGIYAMGFSMASFLGFLIPGAIVFGLGGLGAILIWKYL